MTKTAYIPRVTQSILLITLFLLLFAKCVNAENIYQKAEKMAKTGNVSGMAEAYLKILKNNPDDIKAKLGYATASSWQGNHQVAQKQFNEVLKKHPDNMDALVGLGYDHAWSHEYKDAEIQFNKALVIAPDNVSAQKGLAFTYLWSERPKKALEILQPLEQQYPNDAEILAAEGQARLALHEDEEARRAFQRALIIAPGRPDAISGLATINQKKSTFDFIAWAGDTSNGGASGLREVIVGYWIKDDIRLWARYDNSLSLDNPALARSGEDAKTFYIGALTHINKQWQGSVEIGTRDLPDNADQRIYKVEAIHIDQLDVLKLGVQLSPHSAGFTDKLIYSSYGFPVNDKWRLEPSLFLSSSGAIDDKEWRAVLFGEYVDPDRWSVGLSAGAGRISSDLDFAEGSVFTSNLIFSYPISQKNRLNLAIRYEETPTIHFTTVLIGIAVQLP